MRIGALSIHTGAIALAAISFASSADAGLVLCGDVTDRALVQTHCGDNGSKKNKLSIDSWLDASTHASTWVLLGDVKFKFGEPKIDRDGKWAQAQLRGGAPSRNIPEPGTLALLSIGLLGAALSCRYKRS